MNRSHCENPGVVGRYKMTVELNDKAAEIYKEMSDYITENGNWEKPEPYKIHYLIIKLAELQLKIENKK